MYCFLDTFSFGVIKEILFTFTVNNILSIICLMKGTKKKIFILQFLWKLGTGDML